MDPSLRDNRKQGRPGGKLGRAERVEHVGWDAKRNRLKEAGGRGGDETQGSIYK